MKVVAVFVAFLAASLAAPRDVASNIEKVSTPEEASVAPETFVSNLKVLELAKSDSPSDEKVTVESVDKVEDEVEDKVIVEEVEDKVVEEEADEKLPESEIVAPKEETSADDLADQEAEDDKAATAAAAEEKAKDLSEYSAVCRASTGATIEEISTISENPAEDAPRAVKCYIKCIAEHLGVVKDQVVQKDIALKSKPSTLSTDELDLAVETCSNLKTDDPCDSSYLRYSCYFRTTGKKVRIF